MAGVGVRPGGLGARWGTTLRSVHGTCGLGTDNACTYVNRSVAEEGDSRLLHHPDMHPVAPILPRTDLEGHVRDPHSQHSAPARTAP